MSVVLLVAATVSLLIAWAAAAALVLLGRWVPLATRVGRHPWTALRAAFVLGPLLFGLLTSLVILVPSPLAACHCFAHDDYHPHLCLQHPWLALPLLAPAWPIALLWLGFSAWRAGRVVRELARAERWAQGLRSLPAEMLDGVAVRLVDGLALGAFTVGIWRPLVVVDRQLWARLEPTERLAVVHHESAHAQRRDGLTLACLRLVTAVLPWSARGVWLKAWRAASEAVCDRHAALQLKDVTCVAMALVSVERLRAVLPTTRPLAPALGIAAGTELEGRVRALLDEDAPSAAPLANDLLAVGIALLGLVALVLAWPGSSLHHVVESLLGALTH